MKLVFEGQIEVLVSVNKMYEPKFNFKTRKPFLALSSVARNWKERAKTDLAYQYRSFPQRELKDDDSYNYSYEFSFPDSIGRDPENYLKIITDAIQEAGIIKNDKQVRKGMFISSIDRTVPYKKVNIKLYQEN